MQYLQMSSVVFYGSKLLKAGVKYGNMKLVTIRTVQVRARGKTLQLDISAIWLSLTVFSSSESVPCNFVSHVLGLWVIFRRSAF